MAIQANDITVKLVIQDEATQELKTFEREVQQAGRSGSRAFDQIERGSRKAGDALGDVGRTSRRTTTDVDQLGDQMRRTGQRTDQTTRDLREFESQSKRTKVSVGKLVTGLAAALAAFESLRRVAGAGFGFIEAASRFEESAAKFGVVFGDEAIRVADQLDELSGAVNRSRGELVEFASGFQDIFVPLGFARDEAADLSVLLTQLAIDVGSFNNRLDTDVINDFKSALVGQSETVRKYGIIIDEARIKQVAYENGLADVGEELTAQEKVFARYLILLADSADAQGDAERTANSFANTIKGLRAAASDLSIVFGAELQEVVREVVDDLGGVQGVTELIKVAFAGVTTATEGLIRTLGGAAQGFKGLIDELGGADRVVALLRGELVLTEDVIESLGRAASELPDVFLATFEVLISASKVAGRSIGEGMVGEIGSAFDLEFAKFAAKAKVVLENPISAAGALVGGVGVLDITEQDVIDETAKLSKLAKDEVQKAFTTGLEGVDLTQARGRLLLAFADFADPTELVKIAATNIEGGVRGSQEELERRVNGYLDRAAELLGDTRDELDNRLQLFASLDPGTRQRIIDAFSQAIPIEDLEGLFRENQQRISQLDFGLLRLADVFRVETSRDELEADLDRAALEFQDVLNNFREAVNSATGNLRVRDLDVSDLLQIQSDPNITREFVQDLNRQIGEVLREAQAAVERIERQPAREAKIRSEIAPEVSADISKILAEAQAAGFQISGALFDQLVARAQDLGIDDAVLTKFRAIRNGVSEQVQAVADDFAILVEDINREIAETQELGIEVSDEWVDYFLGLLAGVVDNANDQGVQISSDLVDPIIEKLLGLDLSDELRSVLEGLRGVAATSGEDIGTTLGSALALAAASEAQLKLQTAFAAFGPVLGAALSASVAAAVAQAKTSLEGLSLPELEGEDVSLSVDIDKQELDTLKRELDLLKAQADAGIRTKFEVLDAQAALDIAKITADTKLTEEQRARQIEAINGLLALQRAELNNIAAAQAVGFDPAEDPLLANIESYSVLQEQILRTQELQASLNGTYEEQAFAINQSAEAAMSAAIAQADASELSQELLQTELDLIDRKREKLLRELELEEQRQTLAGQLGTLLSDQKINQDLINGAVQQFDQLLNGLAQTFVDSEASWADFRDMFIQSLGQMIVKALLLLAIQTALGAADLGAFGDVFKLTAGLPVGGNRKGGVIPGVGSMESGPAPGISKGDQGIHDTFYFAKGGILEGVSPSLEGDVPDLKLFAKGGILEGVSPSLEGDVPDLKLFATGGLLEGVKPSLEGDVPDLKLFATGGLLEGVSPSLEGDAPDLRMFATGGILEGVRPELAGDLPKLQLFATGGVVEGVDPAVQRAVPTLKQFATGGVLPDVTTPASESNKQSVKMFEDGGVMPGARTMKAHADDLHMFAKGGLLEDIGSELQAFANGGIMPGHHEETVRAFAKGGIMPGAMELPVKQYATGGIAKTPQLAVFGEGRGAEAFVPLPDGARIPVKMDGAAQDVTVNLSVTSIDPQQAADVIIRQMPLIRREIAGALREGTDRSLLEGVRGASRR